MKYIYICIATCLYTSPMLFGQTSIWSNDCAPATREAYAVAFSADGTKALSGSECHPAYVRLWDAASGNNLWTYTVTGSLMCQMGAAFSNNGQYFATIEELGNLLIFDYTTPTPTWVRTIPVGSGSSTSLDFSHDGTKVAVDGGDDTIRVYKVSDGTLLNKIGGHTAAVKSVDFSPNGNWIASASADKTVKIWNANSGALVQTLTGFLNPVNSVRFSADNSHVVAAASDGYVKVWMTGMWMLHNSFRITGESNYQIDISDDNQYIIIGTNITTRVYGAMGGGMLTSFNVAGGGKVYSVDFKPGSLDCITANSNGKITYWNLNSFLTGTDLVKNTVALHLYPNPSSDYVYFDVPHSLIGASFTVFSANGQAIEQGILSNTTAQLAIHDLSAGTYFVRIEKGAYLSIPSFVKQ